MKLAIHLVIAEILSAIGIIVRIIPFLKKTKKPELSIEYLPDYPTCVQEADEPNGIKRKYLKVIVKNTGKGIAEGCEASLTFEKTTNPKRPPSIEPKNLHWQRISRGNIIGALNGDAILDIVFSQNSLDNPQQDGTSNTLVPDIQKTFALISTKRSLDNYNPHEIPFVQDGVGIGETDFKLVIKDKMGDYVEKKFRIKVTSNWHELSMKEI